MVLFVLAVSVAFTASKKNEDVFVNEVSVEYNANYFVMSMFSDVYVLTPTGEAISEYSDKVVEATQDAKAGEVFRPPAVNKDS